ncbi:MAG: pitrilysin family protein [Candidatus Electryoneaceae bacterium]|nr:pitrilysin family protein [Candidatus Electryoneaceae bacterium]
MNRYSLLILVVFVSFSLIVAGCGGTGSGNILPIDDISRSSGSYKDVDVPDLVWTLPDYSEFELSNGIAGLVVEDDEVPLVDFYLSFPSPSDPADKVGLASVVTWALRNGGSINIPADSLNDIIEFKAAGLWIYAGQEQLEVAGFGLKEDLPLLLSLARELIDNPAYPQDKIDLKKSTMLERIRRRNDRPRGIAFREIYGLLYQDHPWGRETSEESVGAITRDDLLTYHRQVFQPSGAVFGITGDIDAETAQNLAQQYFGSIRGCDQTIPPLPSTVEQADPGIYYVYKEATQAFITVGHLTIDYNDPRRHAAVIMNDILGGGGFQSRLTKRIRVESGLAYSTWSSFSMPIPIVGRFMASASTKIDQADRTLALIDEVLQEYVENGPTEEEFIKSQQSYVNSFVWKYEDSDNILNRLIYYKWRGMPLNTPSIDLEAYQNLTLEDVRQAARELLHPDNLVIVLVGDRDQMARPLEDFGEVHELDIE